MAEDEEKAFDSFTESRRSSYSLKQNRGFPPSLSLASHDSSPIYTEQDPWTAYKEKLDREIAKDSQKLMLMRGTANGGKQEAVETLKKRTSSDMKGLESVELPRKGRSSDLLTLEMLEEEEDKDQAPLPATSRLEISETALETAKFQDLQELQTRAPPFPHPRPDPEPTDTPQQPGEPIVNRLQRTFKATQRVPKELLAGQSMDGLRHIIEILISDKQNLQDQLVSGEPLKSAEELVPEEDVPFSASLTPNHSFTTAQSGSIMRQRMFPIRKEGNTEERMRRTNNQSIYQKPVKREPVAEPMMEGRDSPRPLGKLMKTFDGYEAEILKLGLQVEDLKAKNDLQAQVLRLAPEKRKVAELASQMQARLQQQAVVIRTLMDENASLKAKLQAGGLNERQSSCTPSRAASPVGSAFQGASQFFAYDTEGISSVRRVSPKPAPIIPSDDLISLKPEERQVLNILIDLQSSGDDKRFEEYLSALFTKHEASDIVFTLVRYIRTMEEEVFFALRGQVLELKMRAGLQENLYQEAIAERARTEVEVNELRTALDELRKELDRVNNRFQVEMRRTQAETSLAASKSTGKLLKARDFSQSTHQGLNMYLASISKKETKEPYKLMSQKGTFSPWQSLKKAQ